MLKEETIAYLLREGQMLLKFVFALVIICVAFWLGMQYQADRTERLTTHPDIYTVNNR